MYLLATLTLAIGLIHPAVGDPLAASKTWTTDQAAHLLRRAGFGGTPEQIDFLAGLGRQKAVDYLVEYERIADEKIPVTIHPHPLPLRWLHPDLSQEEYQKLRVPRRMAEHRQFERIVRWWIQTMISSPRPLQEKLVLFWHGHFTSGFREVRSSRAMYFQNQLFRKQASGNVRDLLLAVTKDPAMVLYLNTQQNHKGRPNENYARELMELFTMGPGHYSEQDVKEAARAFTGISIDNRTGETIYRGEYHDYLQKHFLGRTGRFDATDIIDIILDQPATAEFLARKFWVFFAYENPDERIVKALADVLRNNHYELKPMLTAMFMSDAFYGEQARFTHIKSPVELLVGTLRQLAIPPADTQAMAAALRGMGQQLMQPPNVKGWDGGKAWITTSTLFNRYNLIGRLLEGTDTPQERRRREHQWIKAVKLTDNMDMLSSDDKVPLQPAYNPISVLKKEKIKTAAKVVDYYVDRLLQRPISSQQRKTLLRVLQDRLTSPTLLSPNNAAAIRGIIHLILSMPEYQLS